jgi:hypothetical protein
VEGIVLGESDIFSHSSELGLESLHHGDTVERGSEINFNNFVRISWVISGVVVEFVGSLNAEDHLGEEFLSEGHQIIVVLVGPIEFTGGELGVMGHINGLVSELLSDFENTLHSSDDKHLKVKLGGNSHEKFHIEVVMEGLEGTGSSSSSDHVHHGGLNFNEVAVSEELSKEVNDSVSSLEDSADVLVNNEIKVTLTVSGVLVHDGSDGFSFLSFRGLGEHVHAVGKAGN